MSFIPGAKQTGKDKAGGFVNNVKVKCTKCGKQQYIKPGMAWSCNSCGH
jgi:ribosomal protein S27E